MLLLSQEVPHLQNSVDDHPQHQSGRCPSDEQQLCPVNCIQSRAVKRDGSITLVSLLASTPFLHCFFCFCIVMYQIAPMCEKDFLLSRSQSRRHCAWPWEQDLSDSIHCLKVRLGNSSGSIFSRRNANRTFLCPALIGLLRKHKGNEMRKRQCNLDKIVSLESRFCCVLEQSFKLLFIYLFLTPKCFTTDGATSS